MRTTYGFDDIGKNDSLIQAVESLIKRFGSANVPGRYLVNSFLLLKHIPEWMPGAGFQRELREIAKLSQKILNNPFEEAKAKMVGRSRLCCNGHPLTSSTGGRPEGNVPQHDFCPGR